ncbi:hypothetical protein COCVIDRAFT_17195 [Bipolaris victoriae FI3]|uniref:Kinesin motor domain-containing protein n=1 Tax=Bipolaris victoriae (strain FI3) TaxID=930091 RepID=W7EBW6_BIPV3|nr:hypothetical protein COCVIDRAFT_17195 [Bipolaris victoriae FI3]
MENNNARVTDTQSLSLTEPDCSRAATKAHTTVTNDAAASQLNHSPVFQLEQRHGPPRDVIETWQEMRDRIRQRYSNSLIDPTNTEPYGGLAWSLIGEAVAYGLVYLLAPLIIDETVLYFVGIIGPSLRTIAWIKFIRYWLPYLIACKFFVGIANRYFQRTPGFLVKYVHHALIATSTRLIQHACSPIAHPSQKDADHPTNTPGFCTHELEQPQSSNAVLAINAQDSDHAVTSPQPRPLASFPSHKIPSGKAKAWPGMMRVLQDVELPPRMHAYDQDANFIRTSTEPKLMGKALENAYGLRKTTPISVNMREQDFPQDKAPEDLVATPLFVLEGQACTLTPGTINDARPNAIEKLSDELGNDVQEVSDVQRSLPSDADNNVSAPHQYRTPPNTIATCWNACQKLVLSIPRITEIESTASDTLGKTFDKSQTITVLEQNVVQTCESSNPDLALSRYQFPYVFDVHTTNQDICRFLQKAIERVARRGGRFGILADGYSGTGKSYTLFEAPDSIARSTGDVLFGYLKLKEVLFSATEVVHSHDRGVFIKPIEFSPTKLQSIKCTERNINAFKKRMLAYPATSAKDFNALVGWTVQSREVCPTATNQNSSRSHLVCQILIPKANGYAMLTLADLAGAEDPSVTEKGSISQLINQERSMFNQQFLAYAENPKKGVFRTGELAKAMRTAFSEHVPLHRPAILYIPHVNKAQSTKSCSRPRLDMGKAIMDVQNDC